MLLSCVVLLKSVVHYKKENHKVEPRLMGSYRLRPYKSVVSAGLTDWQVCGFHGIFIHMEQLCYGSPIKSDEVPSFLEFFVLRAWLGSKESIPSDFLPAGVGVGSADYQVCAQRQPTVWFGAEDQRRTSITFLPNMARSNGII